MFVLSSAGASSGTLSFLCHLHYVVILERNMTSTVKLPFYGILCESCSSPDMDIYGSVIVDHRNT